jgi:hypothetical protein
VLGVFCIIKLDVLVRAREISYTVSEFVEIIRVQLYVYCKNVNPTPRIGWGDPPVRKPAAVEPAPIQLGAVANPIANPSAGTGNPAPIDTVTTAVTANGFETLTGVL